MSNYKNGRCTEIGYDSLSVITRPPAGKNYDFLNYSREELLGLFEKDRGTFGWVDLDTLQTHKPNGIVVDYISDTYMFDTEWDRGQKQPLARGYFKHVPVEAHYSGQ